MNSNSVYGFKVGALYNRQADIHGKLGGQQQGGMSTPAGEAVVILFTGESGKANSRRADSRKKQSTQPKPHTLKGTDISCGIVGENFGAVGAIFQN